VDAFFIAWFWRDASSGCLQRDVKGGEGMGCGWDVEKEGVGRCGF